jgi:hypothetical protein
MKRVDVVLFLVAVACVTTFAFALRMAAEMLLVRQIAKAAGAPVSFERMDFDLRHSVVRIRGLEIRNAQGFREPALAVIPEFFLRYDPKALLQGEIHVPEIRLEVDTVIVEKNVRGGINLLENGTVRKRFATLWGAEKMPRLLPTAHIDRVHLSIRRGLFMDYTGGPKAFVREFDMGILDAEIENLTDGSEILLHIVLASILKADWRTLNPNPARLPEGLRKRGDALIDQLELVFGISRANLEKMMRGERKTA